MKTSAGLVRRELRAENCIWLRRGRNGSHRKWRTEGVGQRNGEKEGDTRKVVGDRDREEREITGMRNARRE